MRLSVTPILKVGLEAKSSVESDETTSDTPSHTFISRKLQKSSRKSCVTREAPALRQWPAVLVAWPEHTVVEA